MQDSSIIKGSWKKPSVLGTVAILSIFILIACLQYFAYRKASEVADEKRKDFLALNVDKALRVVFEMAGGCHVPIDEPLPSFAKVPPLRQMGIDWVAELKRVDDYHFGVRLESSFENEFPKEQSSLDNIDIRQARKITCRTKKS